MMRSAMEADDPYRTSAQVGTCPRCAATIETDGAGRLVCLAGCGEWYAKETLANQVVWPAVERALRDRTPTSWPWGPATCPICRQTMVVAFHEELRFDRCDAHGVWLDAGEAERFFELFKR